MAIVHTTTIRNRLADLVVDLLDSGGANGTLEFRSSGDSEIATLAFSATAFGDASNGIATAASITDDTQCNAGTVTKFVALCASGDSAFSGTVTATGGGGDIVLSSTAIGQGDTISVSSLTYEAPN